MNGVDVDYFKKKLLLVVKGLSNYTGEELARELVRYAKVANKSEAIKEANSN